jgi:acyl-CoA synthetase (NDP forming)/RimJ/RimL family protein N-acetyltransferase
MEKQRVSTGTESGPAEQTAIEFDTVLSDGGVVHIRPIRLDDVDRLASFRGRLSKKAVYRRWFNFHAGLSPADLERLAVVDGTNHLALVATLGHRIIGVGEYDQVDGTDVAEVAFVVEDSHQGRGISTLILEELASAARREGIRRFTATVLPDNRAMLDVFRNEGFEEREHFGDGLVEVDFPISGTSASRQAAEAREQIAQARSVTRILAPRSIAVVGAGQTPGSIGRELLASVLGFGFTGPIYPVNRSASTVEHLPGYRRVTDIPADVDMAVLAVPATEVLSVVQDCAAKGVHGLVVISSGFAETGPEGRQREGAIVAAAREAGMRMIGPNCLGVINTDPDIRLDATFASTPPSPGPVGFLAQSGALGIALLAAAGQRGLGLSSFVSAGNKADVSGNDLLQYWETDDATKVILLYLESFGNPRTFARLARRVSTSKPIIAIKSGRSDAGQRAATSHTAAAATPDLAVDALFHQTGVIRVDTVDQLFDTAQVLAEQPLPAGNRVAVVSNSGGLGILAADACAAVGLCIPALTQDTVAALRAVAPAAASLADPIDLGAGATPAVCAAAVAAVLGDPNIDSVIAVFTPISVTGAELAGRIGRAVAAVADAGAKPVLLTLVGAADSPGNIRRAVQAEATLPITILASPDGAASALARAVHYAEWRAQPTGTIPRLEVDRDAAKHLIAVALSDRPEGGWLDAETAAQLCQAYGIPLVETRTATTATAAAEVALAAGFPVALKADGPTLVHKTERGAVVLGLTSQSQVRQAFSDMRSRLGSAMQRAIVQPMAAAGVETVVGVVHDPSFGPLVMFGLGGVATDLLGDRAFRILPLTDLDAAQLVGSLRSSRLLLGYRGSPPVDISALEDVLLRVARLADDFPEVAEMDLNPVMATPTGVYAVDVKIRIAPTGHQVGTGLRRLRNAP